jgi:hypothetical protein
MPAAFSSAPRRPGLRSADSSRRSRGAPRSRRLRGALPVDAIAPEDVVRRVERYIKINAA